MSSETQGSAFKKDKLEAFLKNGDDWSRLKTSVPGVFVFKMPAYKSSPARLAVELNPVDSSGTPTKRRGLILRTKEELEEFKELFQYEKLVPLVLGVEELSPRAKKQARVGEDVLEL